MGGEAGVSSQPGQGARFWFRIPLLIDAQPQPVAAVVAPLATEPLAKRQARILVVEDNLVNRTVISAILGNLEGFDLTLEMAENGQLAVDFMLQGGEVDPVLMDAQMPVMDGLQATAVIRSWQAAQGKAATPIVALTANAYEEDRQNCFAAGMNEFLAKPLDIKKLEAVFHHWLPA